MNIKNLPWIKIIVVGIIVCVGLFLIGIYVKQEYKEKTLARIDLVGQRLAAVSRVIETFYDYEEHYPVAMQNYLNPGFVSRLEKHGVQTAIKTDQFFDPFGKPPSLPTLRYYATKEAYLLFSVGPDKDVDITQELALDYLKGNKNLTPYTFDPTNGLAVPFSGIEHSSGDIWVARLESPMEDQPDSTPQ